MENLGETYKVGEELLADFQKLKKYGHIGRTGEFMFNYCRTCKSPRLGHKGNENECTTGAFDRNQVLDIEASFVANGFQEYVGKAG
jgi:hypothetical protein